MEQIIKQKLDFYNNIKPGCKEKIFEQLNEYKISILKGFILNYDLVKRFYQTYYPFPKSRVVLCGINPGKNGAGKTGVPFLDFKSLSELLPQVSYKDQEISAQFINSIISKFGAEKFFNHFYLTNISWFGFAKKNEHGVEVNLNYYDLPGNLPEVFTQGFISEMEIVQPTEIIPLSKEVHKTLLKMKKNRILNFPISESLPHPYYSAIHKEQCIPRYLKVLEEHIR